MCIFVLIEVHATSLRHRLAIVTMLRGLANMHGGFRALAGQTNARYLRTRTLRFRFANVDQARSFVRLARYYFPEQIHVR